MNLMKLLEFVLQIGLKTYTLQHIIDVKILHTHFVYHCEILAMESSFKKFFESKTSM